MTMKIAYVHHTLGERVFDSLEDWMALCLRMAYTWFGLPRSWVFSIINRDPVPEVPHPIHPYLIGEHGPKPFPITFEELKAEMSTRA